mmetsp:Transcript_14725/g.40969  ORF Transcript_14725/g.40969 Transcript_14725/m.40969 type:complete len:206 (-) Transcript_14725:355-972(-)
MIVRSVGMNCDMFSSTANDSSMRLRSRWVVAVAVVVVVVVDDVVVDSGKTASSLPTFASDDDGDAVPGLAPGARFALSSKSPFPATQSTSKKPSPSPFLSSRKLLALRPFFWFGLFFVVLLMMEEVDINRRTARGIVAENRSVCRFSTRAIKLRIRCVSCWLLFCSNRSVSSRTTILVSATTSAKEFLLACSCRLRLLLRLLLVR